MSTTIYGLDSVTYTVTVTKSSDGSAYDLTGTTVDADASLPGGTAINATTAITDAANGIFTITFPAATFDGLEGKYDVHARVTKNQDVQTVWTGILEVRAAVNA